MIRNVDAHDGADAGKGEGHDGNQRAITEADRGRDVDAVQQRMRLFGVKHGGLTGFHYMLGSRTECAGLVATT